MYTIIIYVSACYCWLVLWKQWLARFYCIFSSYCFFWRSLLPFWSRKCDWTFRVTTSFFINQQCLVINSSIWLFTFFIFRNKYEFCGCYFWVYFWNNDDRIDCYCQFGANISRNFNMASTSSMVGWCRYHCNGSCCITNAIYRWNATLQNWIIWNTR